MDWCVLLFLGISEPDGSHLQKPAVCISETGQVQAVSRSGIEDHPVPERKSPQVEYRGPRGASEDSADRGAHCGEWAGALPRIV